MKSTTLEIGSSRSIFFSYFTESVYGRAIYYTRDSIVRPKRIIPSLNFVSRVQKSNHGSWHGLWTFSGLHSFEPVISRKEVAEWKSVNPRGETSGQWPPPTSTLGLAAFRPSGTPHGSFLSNSQIFPHTEPSFLFLFFFCFSFLVVVDKGETRSD